MEKTSISQFKSHFFRVLKNEGLPEEEIRSFFFWLTEEFLKKKATDLIIEPDFCLSESEYNQFNTALKGLQQHEPIQYITGETEFYGLPFRVNPSVLIPRPETEELVDWVLDENPDSFSALDIGTGSGCIPIALALQRKNSRFEAWDNSGEALKTAQENAEINGVNVHFKKQDIFAPSPSHINVDILISNPPYVRNLEKKQMQANVLKYEPQKALFVPDKDPLVFYRKIAEIAPHLLRPNAKIYLEINEYLPRETAQLFDHPPFKNIEIKKDIRGKGRFLRAEFSPD